MFIPLQVYATLFKGDGGFIGQYGLLDAFANYFQHSIDDPIDLQAAIKDMVTFNSNGGPLRCVA